MRARWLLLPAALPVAIALAGLAAQAPRSHSGRRAPAAPAPIARATPAAPAAPSPPRPIAPRPAGEPERSAGDAAAADGAAYVTGYNRALQAEGADPAWSALAEQRLASSVGELAGATGFTVHCGRTLCRLRYDVTAPADLEQSLGELPHRVPWPAEGFFHVDAERAIVTVFVVREGATLPAAG